MLERSSADTDEVRRSCCGTRTAAQTSREVAPGLAVAWSRRLSPPSNQGCLRWSAEAKRCTDSLDEQFTILDGQWDHLNF